MQAVKGYLDNGIFTPYEAVTLPSRAEVTLLFWEPPHSTMSDEDKAFWAEFDRITAESAHENELLKDEAFSRQAAGRDLINFVDEGQTP